MALPLLRDERPELQVRELIRIIAERAGLADDSTAEADAEPGLDVGTGPADARAGRVPPGPRTRGGRDRRPPFELPAELAIDTDVARRVIAEFIRGQLRQAGFERAVLGLSGGIDSALVAYLVAEAIGAERLLCVLMPYRTSSAASRADAEEVVAATRCCERARRDQPDGRRLFRAGEPGAAAAAATASAAPPRQFHGPAADGGPLRPLGDLGRARRRDRQQDRVADRLHDAVRRLACAFNPIGDLYKSQVRQLAVAIGVPDAIVRKAPSADLWPGQTDEAEAGFSYPVLDRLLFWRIDKRRSDEEMTASGFDPAMVERVDRMVRGAEFKRQVPPIAKLGPRTAGVDYLYPRRRPGSARV